MKTYYEITGGRLILASTPAEARESARAHNLPPVGRMRVATECDVRRVLGRGILRDGKVWAMPYPEPDGAIRAGRILTPGGYVAVTLTDALAGRWPQTARLPERVWAVVDMDGAIVGRHYSRDAAEAAAQREQDDFRRRQPSGSRSYLPRSVVDLRRGTPRRRWQHSTEWVTD